MPRSGHTELRPSQVALICGVAKSTALSWLESGLLVGHRAAECGWRVSVDSLLLFMRKQGCWMGAAGILPARGHLLVASLDQRLRQACAGLPTVYADELFQAGCMVSLAMPAGIVLDFALGREDCLQAAMQLQQEPVRPTIIAYLHPANKLGWKKRGLFDLVVWSPARAREIGRLFREDVRYR